MKSTFKKNNTLKYEAHESSQTKCMFCTAVVFAF